MNPLRRHTLALLPALAWPGRLPAAEPFATMTEGPFYPPRRWRAARADWDADLTAVAGQAAPARGEHLALGLAVIDTAGRAIDDAEVEIWQCDARGVYHHPAVRDDGQADAGFQGFGAARSDRTGQVAFRTIRPVPYPGRTPHIHVKLRHPAFGELTSQLFVAGDPGNAGDFLWRHLAAPARQALSMALAPVDRDGLRWQATQTLVVPA